MRASSNIIKYFPGETIEEALSNFEFAKDYPELLNGHVFSQPIQFRIRDGASIRKLTDRQEYPYIERAMHSHYWPEDWAISLPDIEWFTEVRTTNRALHEHVWKQFAKQLEDNKLLRSHTTFEDDGTSLTLSKSLGGTDRIVTYQLSGFSRQLYLALDDARTLTQLANILSEAMGETVSLLEVEEEVASLATEKLVYREKDRVLATVHENVSKVTFDEPLETVDSKQEHAI